MELYKYGKSSLRGTRHSLGSMLLVLGLNCRVPSHSSIRNWLIKCGNYRIKESAKEQGVWLIVVDESITFGSDKILLILGVYQEGIDFRSSLKQQEVSVLFVGVSKQWTAESIAEKIEEIQQQKTLSYVVSDRGSNLLKSYKLSKLTHLSDITHVLANSLERLYAKNEVFIDFIKLIGNLRKDWYLSKEKSQFMPPIMRGKLRFANIFPCINWANKHLINWTNLSTEIQDKLSFLKNNEGFFEELKHLEEVFKKSCSIFKTNGFSEPQKELFLGYLSKIRSSEKLDIFKKDLIEYLEDLSKKMTEIGHSCLLCSSDIIESMFGKFKQKISTNRIDSLSAFVLTIANLTKGFSETEVQNALETLKIKDFKDLKWNYNSP
jgi:hypothetical protein